ncbi:MAG: glycosyltransferase family 4 protein [Chitinophagaceae bacterium]|nr:glycosyltransferase family 4 protein [Anaerolineae bacterium]
MKIVMFSINPLFPSYVMGGAPKHLQNIALYLGELGHEVTILCTQVGGMQESFQWHPQVTVLPMLRFKQPFPQPYATPAYNLAAALQDMGDYLQDADRFYMHDGEFLFPYAYRHVPTVISLRDNVYPETLLGGFLFQGDKLILISEYSRLYYQHTVGRFFPDFAERVEVIRNGIDWDKFKPTEPGQILSVIPVNPELQPIVLHPHRPEESKGIRQTIAVVDLLVHQYGLNNLIALAPKWMDLQLTSELRDFYDDIQRQIIIRGLQDNFVFHDWVPQELMPEYFSLGSVTLSLGNFVESFGNAVYESLGCGTPTIAARISTHRELLPDHLLDKVDYSDIETAAAIAASIIKEKRRTSPATLDYLYENYSTERQLAQYADVILNAKKSGELVYQHPQINATSRYSLAPWCYVSRRGIYHDFRADYFTNTEFNRLIQHYPQGFTLQQAEQGGISAHDVLMYYQDGYLIPLSQEG